DFDLKATCFEDPQGVIDQTQYTQPCMVAFAAGVTAMFREAGIRPEYAAGLSLGEYSALECAGVLDARAAVELVAFRGKAMARASEGLACGMTAVLMLDRDRLPACSDESSALGGVETGRLPRQSHVQDVRGARLRHDRRAHAVPRPPPGLLRRGFGPGRGADLQLQLSRPAGHRRREGGGGPCFGTGEGSGRQALPAAESQRALPHQPDAPGGGGPGRTVPDGNRSEER